MVILCYVVLLSGCEQRGVSVLSYRSSEIWSWILETRQWHHTSSEEGGEERGGGMALSVAERSLCILVTLDCVGELCLSWAAFDWN